MGSIKILNWSHLRKSFKTRARRFFAVRTMEKWNRLPNCKENPIYVLPEKKLRGLSPNFTFMYLWAIYILPRSVHLFSCSKIGRPTYRNRSQKHECKNWDWGRAVSFPGIFVSNFWYIVFAVQRRKPSPLQMGRLSEKKDWENLWNRTVF
jgi:hypothetical protein